MAPTRSPAPGRTLRSPAACTTTSKAAPYRRHRSGSSARRCTSPPRPILILALVLADHSAGERAALAQASDGPEEAVDSQAGERDRAGPADPADRDALQQLGAAEHRERGHGPQGRQGGD